MEKLKLFEAFAGIGTQRMSLRNIGVDFESVGISEIDIHAILSYANIHDGLDTEDKTFVYPSKEEIIEFLENRNIGMDFKTKKVKLPKNLVKLQQLYRAVIISKCYGDVCLLNPSDLPDMDIFTYSFPCTDISVAGQQQGVVKGQTRSGLLYECEKIIEAKRPKYLLLENVKNLVGKKFKEQFDEWLKYLESLGYTNYWQVLNAKDYGVPQNRERVFVVSILNDEDKNYIFPQKQILNIRLKDILESQVEEKYYLSEEVQARFKPNNKFKDMSGNIVGTTAPDFRTIGQRDLCYQENSIMGTLVATDYKQPKQIVELMKVDTLEGGTKIICEQRTDEGLRFFKDNICGTLRTIDSCGDKRVIEIPFELNKNKQNAIEIIKHLEDTEQLNEEITTCDMSINNPKAKDIANCITARYDCGVSNNRSVGVAVVERIGGCFDTDTSTHQAGSVYNENGIAPTLDTMQGGYRQPCIKVDGKLECEGWHDIETRVHSVDGLAPCVETRNRAKYIVGTMQVDTLEGGTKIICEQRTDEGLRFFKDNICGTLRTIDSCGDKRVIEIPFRIRKLTPKECWRLMGCSDEDFYKAKQFNSDSQLYKQAGNAIVVNVLEAIFKNLFKD